MSPRARSCDSCLHAHLCTELDEVLDKERRQARKLKLRYPETSKALDRAFIAKAKHCPGFERAPE